MPSLRLLISDVNGDFEVDVMADAVWLYRGPPGWVPPAMPAYAQGVSLTCPSVTGPGHCLLTVRGRRVFVRDLKSGNGVHVERNGLFHRALDATEVLPDDIVHLGRPTLRLTWLS